MRCGVTSTAAGTPTAAPRSMISPMSAARSGADTDRRSRLTDNLGPFRRAARPPPPASRCPNCGRRTRAQTRTRPLVLRRHLLEPGDQPNVVHAPVLLADLGRKPRRRHGDSQVASHGAVDRVPDDGGHERMQESETLSAQPHTGEALISARSLVKRFGDFTAVDGIEVEVHAASRSGFLGPNGAGKSSTMRMIGCVSPVTEGEPGSSGWTPPATASRSGLGSASCPSRTSSTSSSR